MKVEIEDFKQDCEFQARLFSFSRFANASTPYRGLTMAKIGKRGLSKTPISQCSRNGHFESKSPSSLWSRVEKWGFFVGHWEMGVFFERSGP